MGSTKEQEAYRIIQDVAKVSQETGVPVELLRGATREELEAHAAVIKSHFGWQAETAPVVKSDGNMPENPVATTAEIFGEFMEEHLF